MWANWELIVTPWKEHKCTQLYFWIPAHPLVLCLGLAQKRVFHLQLWPRDHIIIFKTSSLLIRSEKSDGAMGGRSWKIKINGTWGIQGERENGENERAFRLMWVKWQALGHECENLMGLASEVGLPSKMKSLWSWLLWWMKRCARRALTDSGKALEPSPVLIKK